MQFSVITIKLEHLVIGILILIITFISLYGTIKEHFTTVIEVPKYIEVPVVQYVEVPKEIEIVPPTPPPKKEEIVVAFDIDNTIDCGNPTMCIEMCKSYGARLAINTNRIEDSPHDLKLEKIGFVAPNWDPTDYYFNPNAKTSSFEDVADLKVDHMSELQRKYGITDSKRVILVDDNMINTRRAEEKGFSVIQVKYGITEDDMHKLEEILKSLI